MSELDTLNDLARETKLDQFVGAEEAARQAAYSFTLAAQSRLRHDGWLLIRGERQATSLNGIQIGELGQRLELVTVQILRFEDGDGGMRVVPMWELTGRSIERSRLVGAAVDVNPSPPPPALPALEASGDELHDVVVALLSVIRRRPEILSAVANFILARLSDALRAEIGKRV